MFHKDVMDRFKTPIYMSVIVVIGLIMFLHFIEMTQFISIYKYYFDYGSSLRGLCKKEFFEYETSRFQIAANSEDIKISGTDELKYNWLVFVSTILVFLFVSYVFARLFFDLFINVFEKYKLTDRIGSATTSFIAYTIAYTIWFFIILYVFIYLILIFTTGADISIFFNQKSYTKGYYFVFTILLGFLYIIIGGFIVLYICIALKGKQDRYNFLTKHYMGFFCFLIFLAFYVCMFYVLGSVTNIIRNPEDSRQHYDDEQINEKNISTIFFENVLGYKNVNKYVPGYDYIYAQNISGILSFMLILFFIILVIYGSTKYFGGFTSSDTAKQELRSQYKNFLKYSVLSPSLILIIILMISSIATEYNAMINKYLLSDPIYLYKVYMQKINDIFNQVLDTEYNAPVEYRETYLCKNFGNAILNVLYGHIFKDIDKVTTLDITPEFTYSKNCDTVFAFPYADTPEYDITYYINAKKLKKNIMFNVDKCDSVNDKLVLTITSNLLQLPGKSHSDRHQVCMSIYTEGNAGNEDTTLSDRYESQGYSQYLNKIVESNIFNGIINVNKGFIYSTPYPSPTSLTYQEDTRDRVAQLESMHKNNKLKYNSISIPNEGDYNSNVTIHKYKSFIQDKIIKEYNDMSYELLYTYAKYYVTNSNQKAEPNIYVNKYYTSDMTKIITKGFKNINTNMSQPIVMKNGSLTKYIIANYNSVSSPDSIYNNRVLRTTDYEQQNQNPYSFCDFIGDFSNLTIPDYKISTNISTGTSNAMIYKMKLINNFRDDYEDDNEMQKRLNSYAFIKEPYDSGANIIIYEKGIEQYKPYSDAKLYRTRFHISYNMIRSFESYLNNNASNTNMINDIKGNLKIFNDCKSFKQKKSRISDDMQMKNIKSNILKNAKATNDLIYFIIFLYIAMILSTKLIIM